MSGYVVGLELATDTANPGYYRRVVTAAEAAGVTLVTLSDSLGAPTARLQLDAVGVAGLLAPITHRIGLVPTVTTTHTEPFHLQAQIASIDFASQGRAGWQVAVSSTQQEADQVGRRQPAAPAELWREAGEVIEVSRLLWDSWEDDAEIRDELTGRFIDRDKLHYVDYIGRSFSVKGPSIVPRPPQGQPVIVLELAEQAAAAVAGSADVLIVQGAVQRPEQRPAQRVLADLGAAQQVSPDAAIDLHRAGWDGIRVAVRDAADLTALLDRLLPPLRAEQLVNPRGGTGRTLRNALGLPRPNNRFAAPGATAAGPADGAAARRVEGALQ
ncbi:LLM class flavin-dependent oxidoreductase [Nakamurella aerolata]|uniref:LLM class flavin-dependent oxidoreductase n=1 Tax=Nakamurella aerolata TaxID=1656892 RepID=A0A849A9N4_9ACTN|nr:LLM class flavin-dependent oxidoreductase [Nakamurella aerolata]NNG37255.1 LLM class flavin-dependent oxidoreductase [Nakamurella aerolata]